MSDGSGNGRYYWLRLKKDFFKRHDIRIVEEMPNGKDYILFYLKLLCESVDHEGTLRFSEQIPYNDEMLSTVTNTNVDIVRNAVKIFTSLGMMEIFDDGTLYLTEVQKLIGSYADNDNANRQRKFRERQKEAALCSCYGAVTKNNERQKIDKDKEEDKEEDKEIDKEKDKADDDVKFQTIVDMFNGICVSYPRVQKLSDKRKRAINARLKTYSVDDFKGVFEKAEASSFLKGGNGRDWSANFDWLICDGNMAKVLDGNYDDKKGVKGNGRGSGEVHVGSAEERWHLRADVE